MSRRSSRAKPQRTADSLPDSVKRGLTSLITGNEAVVAGMLDMAPDSDLSALLGALIDVLAVNSLSAEGLLAQWFSAPVLSVYAESIGKSPKGNEITLAARIASAWASPSFQPPASLLSASGSARTSSASAVQPATPDAVDEPALTDDPAASGDGRGTKKRKRAEATPKVAVSEDCMSGVTTGNSDEQPEAAGIDGDRGEAADCRRVRGVVNTRYVAGRLECKVRWEGRDSSEDRLVPSLPPTPSSPSLPPSLPPFLTPSLSFSLLSLVLSCLTVYV